MPLVIVIIFYSYTAYTGYSILAVDLSSFVIAVVVGQVSSYKLLNKLQLSQRFNWLGLSLLILGALLFIVFTFFTPHLEIFRDPVSNGYGIIE